MPKEQKKITFSGSLTRRVLLVCLTLLVIPLAVHTFLLYNREIVLVEGDIRSTLKALGEEFAANLSVQTNLEWKVLDAETPALIKAFDIKKYIPPKGATSHFTYVSRRHDILVVGKKIDATEAHGIAHSIPTLLQLQSPPFPIDLSLSDVSPTPDLWTETFPVPNTTLTLVLSTSSDRIIALQKTNLLWRIGSFVAIILILGGTLVYWLIRKLNRPLHGLQLTMERVSNGAPHSRFSPLPWGFEINQIGRALNHTLDRLLEQQQRAEKERLDKERLAYELNVGRDIQASLLPLGLPPLRGLEGAAGYLPSQEVSGDFFDVYPLSNGKTFIAIGDVSGKGISACLYSLGLRSSLRSFAEATNDLSQLARQTNEQFILDTKESGIFATLWLGLYDHRHLTYASFGHPPVLLKTATDLRELSTGHPAFGLDSYRPIEPGTVTLELNDTLLLYTDGVTEAHNPDQKLYGLERLKKVFSSLNQTKSPVDHLLQDVEKFSHGALQHDDIALLWLRIAR